MEPIPQDKRVSQGQNGDLYFSNVLAQDALTDYSCNARFHFTHTIQQKNPYTLKVKTSKWLTGGTSLGLIPSGFPAGNASKGRVAPVVWLGWSMDGFGWVLGVGGEGGVVVSWF